jgi:hypothetical protein
MSVFIECEDPRVLAEHQAGERRSGRVEVYDGAWRPTIDDTLDGFTRDLAASCWRFRLVFPDAAAAGRGLVDYAQRFGARVLVRAPFHSSARSDWVPASDSQAVVEGACRSGVAFRIAAPAAPAEEPRPDTVTVTLPRQWVEEYLARDLPDSITDACRAAIARPALPDGVEPVAWSDRYEAWVLRAGDVPDGWEFNRHTARSGPSGTWVGVANRLTRDGLVLARPTPEPPQPETERVPWWEAVGREVADCERIISVKWVEGEVPFVVTSVGDVVVCDGDSAVEVLKVGAP